MTAPDLVRVIRTDPTVFEVAIDLVDNRPPLNANDRLHWRAKSWTTAAVRTTTAWRVKSLGLPPAAHLTVQLHFETGDNRKRRDPANLCATSKPAIDGLVDSGLVEDDSPGWVTELMPLIHNGPPMHGQRGLWLQVTVYPIVEETADEECAVLAKLQEIADQYPASVFTPGGLTSDGIAGTAIRERMLAEIRMMREAGS